MRTVAIVFGDNDFQHTFTNILHAVKAMCDVEKYGNPAGVEEFIRGCIKPYYIAFQYCHEGSRPTDWEAHVDKTVGYLQGIKVLFDEEAEKAYQTEDHNSGAWIIHLPSGQVNSF